MATFAYAAHTITSTPAMGGFTGGQVFGFAAASCDPPVVCPVVEAIPCTRPATPIAPAADAILVIDEPLGIAVTADGDLEITGQGIRLTGGLESVADNIDEALRTFLGEWYLDLSIGTPYHEDVLGQRGGKSELEAKLLDVIRTQILTVSNVTKITKLTAEHDVNTRASRANFEVLTPFGTTAGSVQF